MTFDKFWIAERSPRILCNYTSFLCSSVCGAVSEMDTCGRFSDRSRKVWGEITSRGGGRQQEMEDWRRPTCGSSRGGLCSRRTLDEGEEGARFQDEEHEFQCVWNDADGRRKEHERLVPGAHAREKTVEVSESNAKDDDELGKPSVARGHVNVTEQSTQIVNKSNTFWIVGGHTDKSARQKRRDSDGWREYSSCEKDREYVTSRPETNRTDNREQKTALIPKHTQVVCMELLVEAEVEDDDHDKLILWLYSCRPAARAGERFVIRKHWKSWVSRAFCPVQLHSGWVGGGGGF